MESNNHRIRKQKWSIRTDSPDQAFTIREEVSRQWETMYLPIFEKAFDELSSNSEVIRISRLNLSIRTKKMGESPEVFKEEIYRQIKEQLTDLRHSPSQPQGSISIQSKEIYWQDILLAYLGNGNLPWNLSLTEPDNIVQEFRQIIQQSFPEIVNRIEHMGNRADALFRLLQLARPESDKLQNGFKELFPADWQQELLAMVGEILKSKELPGEFDQYSFASALLDFGITHRSGTDFPFMEFASSEAIQKAISNHYRFFIDLPQVKSTQGTTPWSAGLFKNANGGPAVKLMPEKDSVDDPFQDSDASDLSAGIFVEYAGLVLIHPFIASFFIHTGILRSGETDIKKENLVRALALIHYLATGNEVLSEFNTTFLKVLLGVDPSFSLPVSSGFIHGEDKEEVRNLLNSVISHWEALRNTSAEAFRESFLLRRGILKSSGEQWNLIVESRAFDVLIDSIPWSFNVFRLPWMKRPIFTEWRTL